MVRFLRSAGLAFAVCACASVSAFAQAPPLVFTVAAPERSPSETILQASAVVEERGVALWGGTVSDFGIGVALSGPRWTIRSITSMTTLPLGSHDRPTFQQIEIVRPVLSTGSISVAGGGGIRQEWNVSVIAGFGGGTQRREVRSRADHQAQARRRVLGQGHRRLRFFRSRPGAHCPIQQSAVDGPDGEQAVPGPAWPGCRHEGRRPSLR